MRDRYDTHVFFSFFQSLTEDVARQTEREKHLQVRYATLKDTMSELRSTVPVNGHSAVVGED